MAEIISFEPQISPVRFTTKKVTVTFKRQVGKRTEEYDKSYCCMVLKNIKNDRQIVHPLTHFVFDKWKNRKYQTQKLYAGTVVMFLNYIFIDNSREFNLPNLSSLKFEHGNRFLNHLIYQGASRTTINARDRALRYFYYYLAQKGKLTEISVEDFEFAKQPLVEGLALKSPFKVDFPPAPSGLGYIQHDLPEPYILLFLETAVETSGLIALGIYFQLFGGLRESEVCSVKRADVHSLGPFGERGLVVKLGTKEGVKKPRYQCIWAMFDWLQTLYKNHKSRYIPLDGSDALFVNTQGRAMTPPTYTYQFNKVKRAFLKKLRESDNLTDQQFAIYLEEKKWATHLGRGVFSHLAAEVASTVLDIAVARGDSSLQSSLSYLSNTEATRQKIQQHLNVVYTDFLPNRLSISLKK